MTTKTKTKWRLSKLPTPDELVQLVQAKIITADEAKEILVTLETEEDADNESLKAEIKFLRELVNKLSNSRTEIIRQIEYIEKPYRKYNWWGPYDVYCTATNGNSLTSTGSVQYLATSGTAGTTNAVYSYSADDNSDFTSIKTF